MRKLFLAASLLFIVNLGWSQTRSRFNLNVKINTVSASAGSYDYLINMNMQTYTEYLIDSVAVGDVIFDDAASQYRIDSVVVDVVNQSVNAWLTCLEASCYPPLQGPCFVARPTPVAGFLTPPEQGNQFVTPNIRARAQNHNILLIEDLVLDSVAAISDSVTAHRIDIDQNASDISTINTQITNVGPWEIVFGDETDSTLTSNPSLWFDNRFNYPTLTIQGNEYPALLIEENTSSAQFAFPYIRLRNLEADGSPAESGTTLFEINGNNGVSTVSNGDVYTQYVIMNNDTTDTRTAFVMKKGTNPSLQVWPNQVLVGQKQGLFPNTLPLGTFEVDDGANTTSIYFADLPVTTSDTVVMWNGTNQLGYRTDIAFDSDITTLTDSITAHRTDINTNATNIQLNVDSIAAHRVDIDALESSSHAAVTLSGTPDYITLSGQDIIRDSIDLANDVKGLLSTDNFNYALIDTVTALRNDITSATHNAVTLAGENYLSLSAQQITANPINLASTNVTGVLSIGNMEDDLSLFDNTTSGFLTSYTETDPVFIASPANGITGTQITNWDAAFGWGDHSTQGYLTSFTELDPVFGASAASGIVAGDITNWNTAFSWGNHSLAGYLTSEVDGSITNELQNLTIDSTGRVFTLGITSGNTVKFTDQTGTDDQNITGGSFATGTGNLTIGIENGSSQIINLDGRYLTSFSETNDLSSVVTWANVPDANITQSSVTQHQAALTITESQISDLSHFTPSTLLADYGFTDNSTNWNTAFSWGDHALAGYLTSEVDGSVTNELQNLTIDSTGRVFTLGITDGNTVKFTDQTGTDDQTLSLVTNTLSIEDGNSVDLSGYVNTDAQTLAIDGSDNLSITGGNSVSLSPYLDNTDSQTLSIDSTGRVFTISISGGNSIVFTDTDTDTQNPFQTLSWSAGTGGNDEITLSNGGGTITITDDQGTDDQNITGGSFATGTGDLTIGIENGSSQVINLDGRYLTTQSDDQILTLDSTATQYTLSIEDGNSINWTKTVEIDPVFTASASASILAGDITNWNTAYGWGDHSTQGYLTSYTETQTLQDVATLGNTFTGSVAFGSGTAPSFTVDVTGTVNATSNIITGGNFVASTMTLDNAEDEVVVWNSTSGALNRRTVASINSANTLQSVTDNGATTTNAITIGNGSAAQTNMLTFDMSDSGVAQGWILYDTKTSNPGNKPKARWGWIGNDDFGLYLEETISSNVFGTSKSYGYSNLTAYNDVFVLGGDLTIRTGVTSGGIGNLWMGGLNVAAEKINYAGITTEIIDGTDASEDGLMNFFTMNAGSFTNTFSLRSGKVGILKSNPGVALDVNGDVAISDRLYLNTVDQDNSNTDLLALDPVTGEVESIDISNPLTAFDWSGISDGYFVTENGAGNLTNSYAWADGDSFRAGQYTGSSGSNYFYAGYTAGWYQTGIENIAIGGDAMRGVNGSSTGSYNIALGADAGFSITTGNSNILLGGGAGKGITTGRNNISFGESSGGGNATGSYNIFMGLRAGQDWTSGDNNIGFGKDALANLTTGIENIAIGRDAMRGVNGSSTGSYNIALGADAGFSITTGNHNIFLGNDAGQFISTGENNIALGLDAGNALTVENNTIAIGRQSAPSTSGEIVIGNATYYNNTVFPQKVTLESVTEDNTNTDLLALDPVSGEVESRTVSSINSANTLQSVTTNGATTTNAMTVNNTLTVLNTITNNNVSLNSSPNRLLTHNSSTGAYEYDLANKYLNRTNNTSANYIPYWDGDSWEDAPAKLRSGNMFFTDGTGALQIDYTASGNVGIAATNAAYNDNREIFFTARDSIHFSFSPSFGKPYVFTDNFANFDANLRLQQVTQDNAESTALLIDANNEVVSRELGAAAFSTLPAASSLMYSNGTSLLALDAQRFSDGGYNNIDFALDNSTASQRVVFNDKFAIGANLDFWAGISIIPSNNNPIIFQHDTQGGGGSRFLFQLVQDGNMSYTTSDAAFMKLSPGINDPNTSNNMSILYVEPTWNNSGASQWSRGIYYNPTGAPGTNSDRHMAFEATAGNVNIQNGWLNINGDFSGVENVKYDNGGRWRFNQLTVRDSIYPLMSFRSSNLQEGSQVMKVTITSSTASNSGSRVYFIHNGYNTYSTTTYSRIMPIARGEGHGSWSTLDFAGVMVQRDPTQFRELELFVYGSSGTAKTLNIVVEVIGEGVDDYTYTDNTGDAGVPYSSATIDTKYSFANGLYTTDLRTYATSDVLTAHNILTIDRGTPTFGDDLLKLDTETDDHWVFQKSVAASPDGSLMLLPEATLNANAEFIIGDELGAEIFIFDPMDATAEFNATITTTENFFIDKTTPQLVLSGGTTQFNRIYFDDGAGMDAAITWINPSYAVTERRNDLELFTDSGDITFFTESGTVAGMAFTSANDLELYDPDVVESDSTLMIDGNGKVGYATNAHIAEKVGPELEKNVAITDTDYSASTAFTNEPELREIKILAHCTGGGATSDVTITLPTPSATHVGKKVYVKAYDGNGTYDVEIDRVSGAIYVGSAAGVNTVTASDGDTFTFICLYDGSIASYGWYQW